MGVYAYAESCSSAGSKQYKYTASECTYSTSTRTCCAATGEWSAWGGSCPTCSSEQCWNGSTCVNRESVSRNCSSYITNAYSGTQTRTATCTSGSGWSYGSWTGTCYCNKGYAWDGSSCATLRWRKYAQLELRDGYYQPHGSNIEGGYCDYLDMTQQECVMIGTNNLCQETIFKCVIW